jgi:hypothetical protein
MSYSYSVRLSPTDSSWQGEVTSSINVEGNAEAVRAVNIAQEAVRAVIPTGILGGIDKTFDVTVSGHINEDHESVEGWSNDFISINILQV